MATNLARLSEVETRLKAVESGLAAVKATTQTMSKEHETLRRSVAEHEEWMRRFEVKLDSAKDAVETIRKEVRATSRERLMVVGFVLATVFWIFVFFIK